MQSPTSRVRRHATREANQSHGRSATSNMTQNKTVHHQNQILALEPNSSIPRTSRQPVPPIYVAPWCQWWTHFLKIKLLLVIYNGRQTHDYVTALPIWYLMDWTWGRIAQFRSDVPQVGQEGQRPSRHDIPWIRSGVEERRFEATYTYPR
jgi:hypothetical protein